MNGNSIRVTVTGEANVPTVELFDSPEEGLIFGIVTAVASSPQGQPQTQPPEPVKPGSEAQSGEPSATDDELIEIVVIGEQDTGYNAILLG